MGNSLIGDVAQDTPAARLSKFYSASTWIEGRAEDQLYQTTRWPGMQAVAAFPDLHPGRHGPVGAAFLADRIYPQLIGPDIGCGMTLYALDMQKRKLKLDKAARRLRVLEDGMEDDEAQAILDAAGLTERFSTHGFSSLGGGNHFCELQVIEQVLDTDSASALGLQKDQLCLLVHSGSRNHGATVFNGIEESWKDGFKTGSPAADAYMRLHHEAVLWARLNRESIARRAADALRCDLQLLSDSVHNAVELCPDGWLHRKGAARPDANGLAPLAGSRESHSFLVNARGAPAEALGSLSHGAGRRYDRASMHGRIRKTRSGLAAMEKTRFGGQVICEDPSLLIEEAGLAYKDAGSVASDLELFGVAQRVLVLAPLITFKTAYRGGHA
jgi:release factor H-coupled RctB family protein